MPLYSGKKLIGTICFIRPYNLLVRELDIFSEPGNTPAARKVYLPSLNKKIKQLNNGTRFSFKDIIGQAPEFLEAIDACRMASSSPSPVMLFGETGTGKELLAQSIHNKSLRRNQHYVALNCAAVPENLLEGILFGTTRGAFTGATDKAGLFEKAGGGTLFLDEINSMSMGLQAKLLRVLQERKIRRVGALEEIPLDLKIISSVNEDPHQSIRKKTIRADLLYRLGVVFVGIPPLRERKEDIPLLVLHFIDKFNHLMGKQVQGVSPRVMALFHRYTWQGNIRELEHVIEGAMNLVRGHQYIRTRHLSVHIGNLLSFSAGTDRSNDSADPSQLTSLPTVSGGPDSNGPQRLGRETEPAEKKTFRSNSREDHEILVIKQTLAQTRGNVAKAARMVNLSPQLLHYKLRKYRIQAADFKPKLKLS
jgi:arginine utilization regulatory protein